MATEMSMSSSTDPFSYDVFLSYGEDTRDGFTANLQQVLHDKKIRTFMDDHDDHVVEKRAEISPSLIHAIDHSRDAIVILSKDYASSTFCLEQLSFILNCIKDKGRLVLPVFYGIDPSDVRHQRGPYGEAFVRHEEKFKDNMEKVLKWRNALSHVSSLSGWLFKHGEKHKIYHIVEEVSDRLNSAPLPNRKFVVGLESPMQEVLSLLRLESDEVLMIGIYGRTGIGKTTLAWEIYNKIENQFPVSFFLKNISNVDVRAFLIKNRLQSKKVLLILDDVDKLEQVEALVEKPDSLGPGSRVIITTQDKHFLTFPEVERIYEARHLNPEDSFRLLKHHIFKQGNYDVNYTKIFDDLITYGSGIPLALEVIGSYMFGKSVEQCESVLRRFKRIPSQDIQNILMIIIDALEKDGKSTFLDIACCFQGYELVEAQNILCAHRGDEVKFHIDELKEKSLLSISSDGMVTLHPLIEGMGKEIVRQESPKEPGRRSRLWIPRDIVHVLKNNTGTDKIEFIHLDSPFIEDEETIEWDGNAFKEMENLRTLIIRKCNFSKAPKYLPQGLRVLDWWRYPSENLPSDFNPNQLVICKLLIKGIKSPKLVELTEESPSGSQVPQTLPSQIPHTLPNVLQTVPIRIPHTSPSVPRTSPSQVPPNNSQSFPLAPQNSQIARLQVPAGDPRDPEPIPPTQAPSMDFVTSNIWRIVGILSSLVGFPCFAFSPSFIRLIRGWNTWKFILYYVFCYGVLVAFSFVKQSSPPKGLVGRVWYKIQGFLVLMIIAVYTFYYDKAVDGKPEILSLISNGALVLMSLSYSKLRKLAYEMCAFSFFLRCLTVQLWTINMKLIWIPICFGFPLFFLHESSDPFLR